MYIRCVPLLFVFAYPAAPALAQVVTSEFFSLPGAEGWTAEVPTCEAVTWIDDGWFVQELNLDTCVPPKAVPNDPWTRSAGAFVGTTNWFFEFHAMGTTDQSEIPAVAPISLVAFNGFGISYHVTLASDQVRLLRDVALPLVFVDLDTGVPHRIRVELDNSPPATYRWYIDSVPADDGLAEGPYPANDARVTWAGSAWQQDALNFWDYIRFGEIPIDGSADFDSDGLVNEFEIFYIDECIERSAAGEPAAPSCSWADIDADNTVTCDDWALIQETLWTGPGDPPTLPACLDPNPIPAVSQWGLLIVGLLMLATATIVYGRRLCEVRCERA